MPKERRRGLRTKSRGTFPGCVQTHAHMCAHTHTHTLTHMHGHPHIHALAHTRTHIRIHKQTRAQTCTPNYLLKTQILASMRSRKQTKACTHTMHWLCVHTCTPFDTLNTQVASTSYPPHYLNPTLVLPKQPLQGAVTSQSIWPRWIKLLPPTWREISKCVTSFELSVALISGNPLPCIPFAIHIQEYFSKMSTWSVLATLNHCRRTALRNHNNHEAARFLVHRRIHTAPVSLG